MTEDPGSMTGTDGLYVGRESMRRLMRDDPETDRSVEASRRTDRSQERRTDRSQDRRTDRSQERRTDRSQDRRTDRSQERRTDRSQERQLIRSQDTRESLRRLMADRTPDSLERPVPSAPSEMDISDASILSTEPLFPCHITERQVPLNTSTPRQYGRRQLGNRSGSVQESDVSVSVTSREVYHESIAADPPTIVPPVTAHVPPTSNTASRLREYELTQQQTSHPLGFWKNGMSSMLACLGTTIGLFNISRFAILSVQFGVNFILQFMLLSFLVGIPLFTFHVSLGQLLAKGPMQMWKISPVFRGVGISLLISQLMIGVYSSIGITWMLVYFKDSFITKQDVYRWAVPIDLHRFRESNLEDVFPHVPINLSFNIKETTADYFHGVVLQRYGSASNEKLEPASNINFSLALNSALVWLIVCVCLRKGLKLYGKVIFLYTLFPIFGLFIFCAKLLRLTNPTDVMHDTSQDNDWTEFFLNTKSWTAAFSESFYTWGLLGAASMQIAAHNPLKHTLHKDVFVVVLLTFAVLILAGFLGNTCVQLLLSHGYHYVPSSFERTSSYHFLQNKGPALAPNLVSTPIRWMKHSSLILGERTIKPGSNLKHESGYQALRLATELVPATFAALGSSKISPFWSVLFYFSLILIGLAQQLAIWHCVVAGIGSIDKKRTDSCYYLLTVILCLMGFLMGLPLTTESGIYVVYFLDCTIGSGWWIVVLYFLEISALFMVRGRPYSGETVVATLFSQSNHFLQNWIAPLFAFDWNVILPVILLFLASSLFRNGSYRQMFNWQPTVGHEYWPIWNREVGSMIMLTPLLLVLLVAILQTFRYMWYGPVDIFDRLQMLYRPNVQLDPGNDTISEGSGSYTPGWPNQGNRLQETAAVDDSPPKYTPPPSYSTATGARLAKAFRQSLRRSVRRVRAALNIPPTSSPALPSEETPPPEYSVSVEHYMHTPPPPGIPADTAQPHNTAATFVNVEQLTANGHSTPNGNTSAPQIAVDISCNDFISAIPKNSDLVTDAQLGNSQLADVQHQMSDLPPSYAEHNFLPNKCVSSGQAHSTADSSSDRSPDNIAPEGSSSNLSQNSSEISTSNSAENSTHHSSQSISTQNSHSSPIEPAIISQSSTDSLSSTSNNSSVNSQNDAINFQNGFTNDSENVNSQTIATNSADANSEKNFVNCKESTSPINSQNLAGNISKSLNSKKSAPSNTQNSAVRGTYLSASLRGSKSSHARRSLRSRHSGESGGSLGQTGGVGRSLSVECLVKETAPMPQNTVLHLTSAEADEEKDTEV